MYNVYSVNEAAEKLGLKSIHRRRLLAKGDIEGKKPGPRLSSPQPGL